VHIAGFDAKYQYIVAEPYCMRLFWNDIYIVNEHERLVALTENMTDRCKFPIVGFSDESGRICVVHF